MSLGELGSRQRVLGHTRTGRSDGSAKRRAWAEPPKFRQGRSHRPKRGVTSGTRAAKSDLSRDVMPTWARAAASEKQAGERSKNANGAGHS